MKKVVAKGLAILAIGMAMVLACGCTSKPVSKGLGPIVRLENQRDWSFCSGAVISKTRVLTAAHCLERLPLFGQVNIVDPVTRETVAASVESADPGSDLAILTGDFSKFRSLGIVKNMSTLLNVTNSLTSQVFTCGFPRGSSGVCEKVTLDGPEEFVITAKGGFMLPGMSGGPVIDPKTGLIIAINLGGAGDHLLFSPLVGIEQELSLQVEGK